MDQTFNILDVREAEAVRALVELIRRNVPADLVQASLFGSRARGDAGPDSDIDILLIFRWLPLDREPQASQAEEIAERVATRTGVPVTVWSVSLPDLERGWRTPMLVDALEDARPLWCGYAPIPVLPFTPEDALRCVGALLERVEEGSHAVEDLLGSGHTEPAWRRGRDDIVRLCTAEILLRGVTRPRRGEAVRAVLRWSRGEIPHSAGAVLRWAEASFGRGGRDEDAVLSAPPGGMVAISRTIAILRKRVVAQRTILHAEVTGS